MFMRSAPATAIGLVILCVGLGSSLAHAADLVWEVESPFRFFKDTSSFKLQEQAYQAVRGDVSRPVPDTIVRRTERRLNDPDCKNRSNPDACAASAGKHYQRSRLGWAATTLDAVCYDTKNFHYLTQCQRHYSWGTVKEDYVLPEAHTVHVHIAPQLLAQAGKGQCAWSWRPRRGGKDEHLLAPCSAGLTIKRVPYSLDRKLSGVTVAVRLPDGRDLFEPNVVVDDVFIVALGDSFASGESNPDRPVTFSAVREMVYDPTLVREDQLALRQPKTTMGFGLASGEKYDPKTLPRRLLGDEKRGLYYKLGSPQFTAAFDAAAARWLSADCHRSQYGYPFRVGIELALENPHRSVTLVSLACSGAEVAAGLFLPQKPRPGFYSRNVKKVTPQFDQLTALICRGGEAAATSKVAYRLPLYSAGSKQIQMQQVVQRWCPPGQRKRPIDLVLMSIGGNDVGFGGLAAYAMTDKASDLAPIVGLIGHQVRFGPDVSRVYLNVLDERMKAVHDALRDGFGVAPDKVLQTAYEPLQYDEKGAVCGAHPELGMDVHPKLQLGHARLQQTTAFLHDFLTRLECISNASRRGGCPKLATGPGTGFNFVTDHLPEFAKRGICARDPKNPHLDGELMAMPRRWFGADGFRPYSPAAFLPYEHRWRLFRTPNDAFLTANIHATNVSLFDIIQPVYAGLYSGAIHPTAEGHAIVADHVVRHARALLAKHEMRRADAR
jgi:hypothetical protein